MYIQLHSINHDIENELYVHTGSNFHKLLRKIRQFNLHRQSSYVHSANINTEYVSVYK